MITANLGTCSNQQFTMGRVYIKKPLSGPPIRSNKLAKPDFIKNHLGRMREIGESNEQTEANKNIK